MSDDRDYTDVELIKRVGHLHFFRNRVTGEEFSELGTPAGECDANRNESRVKLYIEFEVDPSVHEIMALRAFSSNLAALSIVDLKEATRSGNRLYLMECYQVEADHEISRGVELGLAIRLELIS